MAKRDPYRDHIDPEVRRWGRAYRSFPGVAECVRLLLTRNTQGTWLDIIVEELSENAGEHLDELIAAFREHRSDRVATFVMMALHLAKLPASVDFLAGVLQDPDPEIVWYARRALQTINTRESRTAMFLATQSQRLRSPEAGSEQVEREVPLVDEP